MINKRSKITVVLEVEESEDISEGVCFTKLTHPKLQGELSFTHSPKGGREEFLQALDENVIGSILDAAFTIGGMLNGKGKDDRG